MRMKRKKMEAKTVDVGIESFVSLSAATTG
jgi:hypothetical protein